jgi:hypothetical protein
MNKGLFIAVTVVLVALFGTVVYYGMQALEPHTYVPPLRPAGFERQAPAEESTVTALSLPALPGLPIKTIPSNFLEPSASSEPQKVLATEEQLAYLATSTIREVNAEKLFFAPHDSNAFPYGKNDIFVLEQPSSLVRTSLWTINTSTKTVTRVAGPAFGLMARWSKNGRYVFTMNTDGAGALSLSFIDTKLKNTTPLRIATLPSKCFIQDNTPIMYCGVPQGAPEGIMLPDDYLKGKFVSTDRIIKIDFKTPKVTELWSGESESLDIQNPALIGNVLFFTNKTDDSVWKLAL